MIEVLKVIGSVFVVCLGTFAVLSLVDVLINSRPVERAGRWHSDNHMKGK